jgi:hypothetical protein
MAAKVSARAKFKIEAERERRVPEEAGTKKDEIVRSMVEPFCSKRLLEWTEQIQCEGYLVEILFLAKTFVYKSEWQFTQRSR